MGVFLILEISGFLRVRREDQSGTSIDYALVLVSTIAQCHPCFIQLLTFRIGMIRCP
jgi:hypothetical protein